MGNDVAKDWSPNMPEPLQPSTPEGTPKRKILTLAEIYATHRFDQSKKPPEAKSVYRVLEVTICTGGNLTAITAQAKAGKTAFLGAMIASALTECQSGADTFGIFSENPNELALLHFDTEQSPFDHYEVVATALKRAQVEEKPDWLQSFWLKGTEAKAIQRLVKEIIVKESGERGGIHSILLDGIGDMVVNVNDPGECNDFISELEGIAVEHDCPVVGVIHFNPGTQSGKVRGHLGSQLERKSETNLVLEKDGEVTQVFSEKQRRAPILKGQGPTFTWNTEAQMHVSCDGKVSVKQKAKLEEMKCERDDVFSNKPSLKYCDLVAAIRKALSCSEKTAKRRVQIWGQNGVIEKSIGGLYVPKDFPCEGSN